MLGRAPAVFLRWPPAALPLATGASQRGARWQSLVVNCPAGGFVDLPGPPAGWLRTYGQLSFITAANAPATMGALSLTLQPSGFPMQTFAAGISAITLAGSMGTLRPGEAVRVSVGGAIAVDVNTSYLDVPNADGAVTVGRVLVSTVPAVLVPTPAVGRISRLWMYGGNTSGSTTAPATASRVIVQGYNRDTITHSINFRRGSSFVGRNVTTMTAGQFSNFLLDSAFTLTASDPPITGETIAAVVTAPPVVYFAYETLDAAEA